MIVISSGEVSSGIGKVSSGGSFLYFESIDELYVLSGGIAEDTTVSGEISWDGEIYGGNMYVNRGGVANGTDVADGFLTISSGGIANNTTLHYGYMTILKGGIANSNDLYYSGSMYVCSGGTANVNSVDNHGWLSVGNGGVASNTTVNAEGFIIVEGGGTATDITMMSKAHLRATIAPDTFLKGTSLGSAFLIENGYVSHFQINSGNSISVMSGVSAEDIAVNNQGYFSVASGGTAINVNVVNGGRLNVTVAPDTYIQGTFGGREFLVDNGHVSGYAVSSGVSLVISAGRSATDIAVKSGGRMLVSSGGSAVNVIVDNGGVLDVAIAPNTYIQGTSGGVEFLVANNFVSRFTIASRGSLAISQGHSATDLTVKSGGTLFVYSGGTATGLTVSNGGVLIATVAQDTYIQGTSDGSAFRVDNGYVSGYNIAGWGDRLHVSSGGTAENTMIANGSMYVNGNGLANETVVQGRGGLFVKDSGTASNTTVNYGTLHVYSGGSAENVQVNLGGSISVYSGGQVSELIENGGFVEIADGAEVIFKSNTIAKLEIGEDQSATLHSNTTAVNVIVHESGSLYVENGGKALNIIENGGYVSCAADADVAFVPNVISGLFLLNEAASATLHSGTTAVDLELFGGRLDVFRGGVAENTTLDFDTADDYWEGGYMMVHSGGLAKNTEIKDDSVLNIRNGGVATGTTVQGGYFWVGSGASAASTTVSYGIIGVLSGGTATGLAIMSDGSLEATVAPDTYIQGTSAGSAFLFDNGYVSGYTIAGWGGRLDVSSGGTALDITVTSRGNLSVSSGGTAANIQVQRGGGLDIVVAPDTYVQGVSAGAALLLENGLLSDYTVENGSMSIIGGGTASSIMVNSGGRLFVSSNGTLKQAAINFAGSLTVSGGGTLEQATVNSSASLFVSSGGTATGITMESGAYLSVVVAPDTLIQAVSAGRAINVKDGIAIGLTVESGRIDVRSGGLVDNTTVCSNYLDVNNGGVASNTMVENGSMYVSSGGFAVNTTVHAAGRVYVNGGVTSDNWIQANGMMYINWEGAVASGTVVDANGSLVVSSGGTANKTVLLENGVLFNRSGGLVTNLQLHSGARIDSLLENTGDDIAQISVLSGNVAYEVVSGGVWKGELMVGKDTQVTGVAGAFTLKTVESGSCTVTGSDLSQVEFSLEPGSVVNLSGNYFGTTDIDAIYKTYGFSRDSIIIDDVLLTNPTTSFNVTVSGLKQNTFGLDTRTLTLLFSHDVDETTVTDNSFQLISPDGTPVSITSWSLSGKTLKLNFESLAEEGRYKLLFADAIKDVNGDVLESIHSSSASAEGWAELLTLRADFTPLRVVSISPEGDFAGTLKEFRVTFSEAVDRTNVAKNVILTGPNGMDIEPSSFTIANGTAVFTLSPQIAYGQYTITVLPEMSDLAGNMLDQNNNGMPDEAADEFTANFTIADVDLKVSEVQLSSSELMPGESLTVSWKDYNNGGFALVGDWTDGVYLSSDTRWDVQDVLLGNVSHTGGLEQNQTLDNALTVSLTGVTAGPYYILVRSDIFMQEKSDREAAAQAQNLVAVPITVSVPKLSVDEPQAGQFSGNGDFAYYVVRQEANESLQIVLDSLTNKRQNLEVFVGYNAIPNRENFDLSLKNITDGALDIETSSTGRDIYIMVNAKSVSEELEYTLTAQSVPLTITSVTPAIHGHASDSTFDIIGVDFTPGSTVEFVDENGNQFFPDDVSFVNSNRLKVDFAAGSLPAGRQYRIVVSNGTETAELSDAVTITGNSGANFTYAIRNIPSQLSPAQTFTFSFTYNNIGVDAMDAPLVIVSIMSNGKADALLALDDSDVSRGFWTSTKAQGFSGSVQFLATGTTPGLLQPDPGDTHGVTVPIYYAGWRGGDFSGMRLDYYVTVINSDDATAMDWGDMLDGLEMPEAYKSMLTQNLTLSVGETWGDYVRMLNDNLGYLDRLDLLALPDETGNKKAISIDDMFGFEMLQNNGALSPYRTLQSSTDLSVVAPGLGLGVSRSYNSDLSSRFTESSFGYGWSCNWDMALEISEDGDLTVKQGTTSRLYQPNYTNGYQTVAGDGSRMARMYRGYKLTERDGSFWFFSEDGQLTSVTDTNGNAITCGYDENGRLATLTHTSGEQITITRDEAGRITTLADTHGNGASYTYDANGNLTSVTDAASGVSVSYAYGDSHNLTQVTGIDGNAVSYAYNEMGLLSEISSRDGAAQVSIAYGTHGEVTMTDQQNGNVTYFYGDNGLVAKATDNTTGISTYYRYDDDNQLVSLFDSRGNSVGFTYNANGDLTSMTDQQGNVMRFVSDGKGNSIRLTDARGNVTEYTYDAKNNLTGTYYADGTSETYAYDNTGNLLSFTDVKGDVSSFQYDAQGRVTSTTFNGKTTGYAYDANSNVTSVTWADGTQSQYAYNAFDEMTLFTDAKGNQTAYAYDEVGRLTGITYADNSAEAFAYNDAGDLVQWTNRRGGTVTYTVDALGNTTKLVQTDGMVIDYAYDAQNRLVQSGDLSFAYNDLDYVTSITANDGRVIDYAYDSQDRVVSISDGVNVTNYSYTVYGELDTLTNASGALIADYDYDRYGRLSKVTNGNGTYTTYSYNAYGEVTAIDHYGKDDALTAYEHYTYNADNLIATKETADGTWSYTYDRVGQLTAAVLKAGDETLRSEAYAYDAMGNRTQSVIDGVVTNYTYNNLNQIVTANGFAYRYDADGNLLEDEKRTYTWTTDNRVASETLKSTGQTWIYGYDAMGNRTSVTTNGVTTTYTVDANGNVLAEYVNGAFVRSYLQGNSLAAFTDAAGNTYYFNSDLLGSTVGLTDDTGLTVNSYSYDSFGNVLNSTEAVANDFEFVGGYGLMSNASGTTFVRARNYDAVSGRWISADPIGIDGGENLYVYCGNDGGNWNDINGLMIVNNIYNISGNGGYYGYGRFLFNQSERIVNKEFNNVFGTNQEVNYYNSRISSLKDLANPEGKNQNNVDKFIDNVKKGVKEGLNKVKSFVDDLGKKSTQQVSKETQKQIGKETTKAAKEGEKELISKGVKNKAKTKARNLVIQQGARHGAGLAVGNGGPQVASIYDDAAIQGTLLVIDIIEWTIVGGEILWYIGKEYFGSSRIVISRDPNDKLGNAGYGEENYIAPQRMDYTVRFENDPEWATAPARWVRVYDVLDEDFDLDTFELKSFCLAGNLFTVGNGRDSFNQVVKITIGEDEVYVDVKINLDRETREISAEFMAIDPDTGTMSMDITKGLLYPNDETGRGDGDIQYSVSPNEGVENGTELTNVADIYFDFNDPIETPVVKHTIDSVKPVLTEFTVTNDGGNLVNFTFAGTDADSGIYGYNIAYSTDGLVYTILATVTESEWSCEIDLQAEYYFKVQAVDNVGNVSEWSEAQAVSQYEFTMPDGYAAGEFTALAWEGEAAGYLLQLSSDGFETCLSVSVLDATGIDLAGLPEGGWQWRVLDADSLTVVDSGEITGISAGTEAFVSEVNGNADLIFAQSDGQWDANYQACHQGNLLSHWSGTQETVELDGKNRIEDIFVGSADANLLLLTDDDHGDALFLDDIYTNGVTQSRLSGIDQILCGAGDDIVDFTSARYPYIGRGTEVHGGLGDDVIWANRGDNWLFGDGGNDRIVGASGNDVLVGGAGDDALHGGGGNDIFAFGGNWGNDTVEQLADGKVTLWFQDGDDSKWNAATRTYTDGANSVQVIGECTDISLKFGAGDDAARFAELGAKSAFDEFTSEKIFEEKNKGLLA